MNVNELIAIDVHTHAEVSCRQEPDAAWAPFEAASAKYFKAGKRPTIAETIAYYRERRIGLVMFTVDSEFELGARRIPNEEVADAARENSDIMPRESIGELVMEIAVVLVDSLRCKLQGLCGLTGEICVTPLVMERFVFVFVGQLVADVPQLGTNHCCLVEFPVARRVQVQTPGRLK